MNLFNKFDDAVMAGVNAGVHAYNQTFGGTKEDLSDILHLAVPFINAVNMFSYGINTGIVSLLTIIPLEGYITYLGLQFNKEQMKLEENAKKMEMIDYSVEKHFKFGNKLFAYGTLIHAGLVDLYPLINKPTNHINDKGYHYGNMIASSVRSLACLAMCADNLPPRKNIFKRTYEKVSEWAKESSLVHSPRPSYPISLEEQLH